MAKEMLINASEGEECRIAVVEDGKLEELYMERTSSTSHVGNIYKGRVTNVEPSIQAAFIDFGLGRNGFLHISDLMPQYFGKKHEDVTEAVGKKIARRDRPPIQRCLKRGDDIIVQIIKEGIGTKGPTLSTYVSIPGRILVMMPGMSKFGISRKIEDEEERRRLRGILDGLKCPDDVGFIVRTAGVGKNKAEISRDLQYLTRLWKNIQDKLKQPAPQELYTEGDLVTRTVRDVFSSDIEQIVVDNKEVAKRVKEFFKIAMPRTKNKVEVYEDPIPLFHKYNVEQEIEQMYSRHVPLASGGSLVIDQTEAIVAIDVNSGKFRDHSDAETTAFKTDMEAADEIPRQLKLRDLGGVIICDFIDLRFERHRRELEKRLHDNLKRDRAKTKVLRMSQFGIIEMTRQRMRPSLKKSIYCDCPHCKGSGLVKTPESMSLDMMRRLMIATTHDKVVRVELAVHPEVAFYILNKKRVQLAEIESERQKRVMIRHDGSLAIDEFRLTLYDARDGLVYLSELGMAPQGAARPQQGGRGGGRSAPRDQRHEEHRRNQQQARLQKEHHADSMDDVRSELAGDSGREREPDRPTVDAGPGPQHDLVDTEVEGEDTEPSQVVDIDDGHEAMGEAPRGFEEDGYRRFGRDRGRRGGRDRGQQGGRQQQDGGQQAARGQRPPPPRAEEAGVGGDVRESAQTGHPGDEQHDSGDGGGRRRRRRRRRGRRGRGRGGQEGTPQPVGATVAELPHDDADEPQPQPVGDDDTAAAPPMDDYDDPNDPRPAPGNEIDAPPPETRRGGDKKNRHRGGGAGAGGRNRGGRGRGRGGERHRQPPPPPPHRAPPGPSLAQTLARELAAEARGARAANQRDNRSAPQRTPPTTPPPLPSVNVVRTGSTDKHLADDVPADYAHTPRRPRSYRDLDELPDFDE